MLSQEYNYRLAKNAYMNSSIKNGRYFLLLLSSLELPEPLIRILLARRSIVLVLGSIVTIVCASFSQPIS